MTGRHQRDETGVELDIEAETESYLDLYDEDQMIDGSRSLPQPKGRHARPKEETSEGQA